MKVTVEIKGATADRFRAYSIEKMTRKPSAADHHRRGEAGMPPLVKGSRIRYNVEQVAFEGKVSGSTVVIPAESVVVTRVVFYNGPKKDESVVGSVDVNVSGNITVEIIEPVEVDGAATGQPEIIDE